VLRHRRPPPNRGASASYKIKGNPECNDRLQPGFESDMTWIYRVPTTANVVGWAFQDFTEFASAPPSQWAVVRLQT
jgi:hypothetical protein